MEKLTECIFRDYNRCNCDERIFKQIVRGEKEELCKYQEHYDIYDMYICNEGLKLYMCPIFKKFYSFHVDILHKKFDEYLELKRYYNLQPDTIGKFIEQIAKDYFIKHYRNKAINRFIKQFKTKMGMALASKCYEDIDCPYFVIAKDIVENPAKR